MTGEHASQSWSWDFLPTGAVNLSWHCKHCMHNSVIVLTTMNADMFTTGGVNITDYNPNWRTARFLSRDQNIHDARCVCVCVCVCVSVSLKWKKKMLTGWIFKLSLLIFCHVTWSIIDMPERGAICCKKGPRNMHYSLSRQRCRWWNAQ